MKGTIPFFLIDTMTTNAVIIDKLMNPVIEFNSLQRVPSLKILGNFGKASKGAASGIKCINLKPKIL